LALKNYLVNMMKYLYLC